MKRINLASSLLSLTASLPSLGEGHKMVDAYWRNNGHAKRADGAEARSKYLPHQGSREAARRRKQRSQ